MRSDWVSAFLLLLLFPALASADEQSYLRKANPDSLTVLSSASGCPLDHTAVTEITEGVLIRSRIKLASGEDDYPWLSVGIRCFAGPPSYYYAVQVDFVFRQRVDDYEVAARWGFDGYMTFGRGGVEELRDSIKERTEAAVTDYIRANFDLGEE